MRVLGLIGGTNWVSTAEYYRLINQDVNRRLGGIQSAQCIIYSFNHADFIELNVRRDWNTLFTRVSEVAAHLESAGADALVLCANTMHLVADRLAGETLLPIIHIGDVIAEAVASEALECVALLGSRSTMEMDFIKERVRKRGTTVIVPEEEDRAWINHTIFDEFGRGIFSRETKARYLTIIESLVAEGARGVILGCTEYPLLIKPEDCTVPLFNTTALHAKAAVDFALG